MRKALLRHGEPLADLPEGEGDHKGDGNRPYMVDAGGKVLAKMREKCKMRDVGSNPTVMNIPYFEVAKWQSGKVDKVVVNKRINAFRTLPLCHFVIQLFDKRHTPPSQLDPREATFHSIEKQFEERCRAPEPRQPNPCAHTEV